MNCAQGGLAILEAAKEELGYGPLSKIESLVSAEIFTDFLDMAQHLLEAGYKDPSASLIGAVWRTVSVDSEKGKYQSRAETILNLSIRDWRPRVSIVACNKKRLNRGPLYGTAQSMASFKNTPPIRSGACLKVCAHSYPSSREEKMKGGSVGRAPCLPDGMINLPKSRARKARCSLPPLSLPINEELPA
jgi:hypothetical protein